MTKSQTYQTRVLTAQDHRLIDALEKDPRYRKVAHMLRPPAAAPKAKQAEPEPEAEPVPKPVPKASGR